MIHTVYIVGAGPGDPELLTRKAYGLLTNYADVVVYDRLIPDDILSIIPKSVERIYAGKSCKTHVMTQDEINQTLVDTAKTGKRVVRLKGGDPFIFGRGGEEFEFLALNDVPFEIVPGISAASGISALFGVPLTHRGVATGVRFITGHQQKGVSMDHDWSGLADSNTTLVIYMGLANLQEIAEKLIAHGLDASTPALAVQEGTMREQRSHRSALKDISKELKELEFKPPTIIMIGNVASLGKIK